MSNPDPATMTARPETVEPPARTHQQASVLLRRPFAPGAIGFRAMTKVPFNGDAYGGAQVAAFLSAQSITQRLNAVCPGAWEMDVRARPRRARAGQRREALPRLPADDHPPRRGGRRARRRRVQPTSVRWTPSLSPA